MISCPRGSGCSSARKLPMLPLLIMITLDIIMINLLILITMINFLIMITLNIVMIVIFIITINLLIIITDIPMLNSWMSEGCLQGKLS